MYTRNIIAVILLILSLTFTMTWETNNLEQPLLPIKPPSILPIAGDFEITSPFGIYKRSPILGVRPKMHTGTDFKAPIGTPVFATSSGKVVRVQCIRTGYGNNITIEHDSIYKSLYAHLSQINVEVGQTVKRGDVIGEVGSSGASTAPHLHYEVIENGKKVNPENFLSLRAE